MAQIFQDQLAARGVHFLKIAGFDWRRNGPRIGSNEPAWKHREPGIRAAGYQFVWFDGLNRL
jgi:hypothetical protein